MLLSRLLLVGVQTLVTDESVALYKRLVTAGVTTRVRSGTAVDALVGDEIATHCEYLATARVLARVRSRAAVGPLVLDESATNCECLATAGVMARVRSGAAVGPLVGDEMATICKRLATAAVLAHETLHASARRWSRHRLCAALGGRHVKAAPTLTQLRHCATLQLENGNANFFAVAARQFGSFVAAATFFANIASL